MKNWEYKRAQYEFQNIKSLIKLYTEEIAFMLAARYLAFDHYPMYQGWPHKNPNYKGDGPYKDPRPPHFKKG